jgi:endonuclease/exonuclease/phosphatase family metal-dependent hydrolase
VRVLTMNVQNDAGDPRRHRLINQELRRLEPDLVTLQEVCYPGPRDHLAELIEGTGLAYSTHQADVIDLPSHLQTDGTAIATRWPHRVVEVLEHQGDPHWWTLAVLVQLAEPDEQLIIAPTTPWRLDHEFARERQAVEIAEIDARHRTAVPTVIAGDLNAAPGSASIRYLSGLQSLDGRSVHYNDAWSIAGDGPGYTWTTDNPLAAKEIDALIGQSNHHRRIDYIFTGSPHEHPDVPARVLTAQLIGASPPLSDHYGLYADISL